jgi:hypothetical protein
MVWLACTVNERLRKEQDTGLRQLDATAAPVEQFDIMRGLQRRDRRARGRLREIERHHRRAWRHSRTRPAAADTVPAPERSGTQYGALAGLTVYAVPQVLAAAAPIGTIAMQMGTLVKLVRVLMLGPVVLGLTLLTRSWRDERDEASPHVTTGDRPAAERLPLHRLVPGTSSGSSPSSPCARLVGYRMRPWDLLQPSPAP